MFATENQFFPSTKDLARKVYYEANIKDKQSVLDPTAGNGVLLDIVAEYRNKWDRVERYAIEIDQELRFILQGKEHKVIGTNFLTYCEPMEFDRIIMNPPFRIGAEMVLKAWSHLKAGGRLVAILNTETLGNAYSGDRKALANLINQYGSSQELGQAFKEAARRSNVEVVMITLDKPEQERSFDFDAASFTHDEVSAEEFKSNPLAHTDVIKNLVAKYKACEMALKERSELDSKLDFYLSGVSDRVYDPDQHRDIALDDKILE